MLVLQWHKIKSVNISVNSAYEPVCACVTVCVLIYIFVLYMCEGMCIVCGSLSLCEQRCQEYETCSRT